MDGTNPTTRRTDAALSDDLLDLVAKDYRLHLRDAEADLPGASGKLEGASAPSFAVLLERGHLILPTKRFFDARIFDSNRMLR